jgi:uroporphyrinogen III methyltransferase / synthase
MPAQPEHLPLTGRRVVVACSAQKRQALAAGLTSLGADVLPLDVIRIREIPDNAPLDSAVARLGTYRWLVFTSVHAVQFFSTCLMRHGRPRIGPNVCAIGPATAAAALDCGFEIALTPDEFVAEGIVKALNDRHGGNLTGVRILLPGARETRDVIPRELGNAGAIVDAVPCYENVPGEIDEVTLQTIRSRPTDLMVFTSSSTVRNFFTLIGQEPGRNLVSTATIAALGPITARTIESYGQKCDIVPAENSIPSLLEAIRRHYTRTV